jgi:hypothetical protein
MISLLPRYYDKLLLVGVVMALVSGGIWFRSQHESLGSRLHELTDVKFVSSPYLSPAAESVKTGVTEWPEPRAQSPGEDWCYELFGPPDIAFDENRRAFVIRPIGTTPKARANTEAAPALVEVIHEPFRVQLVGSIGEGADRQAILAEAMGGDTFLARANQRFEGLALSVKSVGLKKIVLRQDEFGPVHDVVLEAILYDERNADEVLLTSGVKRFTGQLRAVLQWEEIRLELSEGTVFTAGDWVCRAERILSNPDEVVVTRTKRGLAAAEPWILRREQNRPPHREEISAKPVQAPQRIATHLP